MEFIWFILIFISILCAAAIALLIIPFPVFLRQKLVRLFYKLIYPLFIVILILIIIFFQEFMEQRKFTEKRRNPNEVNKKLLLTEEFKHQRNMYLTLLSIILVAFVCILTRVLNSFVNEYKLLEEQYNARMQVQNNAQANRANDDGIERRNLPQ